MKISISIGVGSDKDGQPVLGVSDKLELVVSRVNDEFGGCSVIHGDGSWKDERGKVVSEPCVIIVIIVPGLVTDNTAAVDTAKKVALFATTIFDQSCVLVDWSENHHAFILRQ
jgi:hypothetical protein